MKTMKKRIAGFVSFALLLGCMAFPAVQAADTTALWNEQFMTPYPYTVGQAVTVGYNDNQSGIMGQWFRPSSTCTVRYTVLDTASPEIPAFSEGYTPSGQGNVQKFEFLAQDQAASSVPGNGIAYRIPQVTGVEKLSVELGFYLKEITNYGSDYARWFRIAFGGAEMKLFNDTNGAATGGPILYQDAANSTGGAGTGIRSEKCWSAGWHKIKMELRSNGGRYNMVNYYYDDMETPLNANPVSINEPGDLSRICFYMGARGTDKTPSPLYYDYITVSAEGTEYDRVLSKPAQPVWSNNVITWGDAQDNTAAYVLYLYRNGMLYATYQVPADVKRYNFTNEMTGDLAANWTVAVQAIGVKNAAMMIGDSLVSAISEPCKPVEIKPLPTPGAPVWAGSDESMLIQWNAVSGCTGYRIKLYKEGTLLGTYSADMDKTTMELTGYMEINGNGVYTASVTAVGDDGESCLDSAESPQSAGKNYTVPTIDYKRVLIDQGFNAPPYNVTALGTPEWNINAVVDNSSDRGIMLRDGKLVIAHGQGTPFSNIQRSIVRDGGFEKTAARYVEFEGKLTGINPGSQFYLLFMGENADGAYAEAGGVAMIGSELRPSLALYSAARPFSPAVPVTSGTAYDIRFRISKDAGCTENDPYTTMKWWVNGVERVTDVNISPNVVRITGIRMGSTTGAGASWAVHPFTVRDNLENLGGMEPPEWGTGANARTLYWEPVTNNRGYEITLYKEGLASPLGQYIAPRDSISFDMEQAFLGAGLGNVYVTIRAKGDGVYTISGPTSTPSKIFKIKPADLAPGPTATNVRVVAGEDGHSLVGTYVYRNTDASAPEGASSYRWLISDTEKGAYEPIPGAVDTVYQLTKEDLNRYIRFEVIPRDAAGTVGEYARSVASKPAVLPVAQDVAFSRNGDVLTGEYTYFHFAGIQEGNTQFKWLMSDFEHGDYRAIPGAVSKTLTLKGEQKLKYIKFEVTPGDSNGSMGYSYRSPGLIDANPDTYAYIAASKLEPSELTTESPSRITQNLTLPQTGLYDATIVWESDKPGIISNTGVVTRPKYGASQTVTLTARVTAGNSTQTRIYKFIVLSMDVLGDGTKKDPRVLFEYPANSLETEDISAIFSDVSNAHWAKQYILFLQKQGILSGTDDGRFEPERPITREEFCKILVEAFVMQDPYAVAEFADVPKDAWYYTSIASALERKIVLGQSKSYFGTGQTLTRQDMAVLLSRTAAATALLLPQDQASNLPMDFAQIEEYAAYAVEQLVRSGILSGDENGNFCPLQSATRAEVAKVVTILYLMK